MSHSLIGLCGSLRKDSYNRKLMHLAARVYGANDFAEADLRFPLYDGDLEENEGIPSAVEATAAQIAEAKAVIIACPEYNQSISGVLKNGLDWISRVKGNPWLDKPVALLHATAGRAGGARANFALRLAMVQFRPNLIAGPEVLVASAFKEIDADGQIQNEMYLKALQEQMDRLKSAAG